MLKINVLAQLDATRDMLEQYRRDLRAVDKLMTALQDQKTTITKEIAALECKIIELEDELDA